MRNKFVENTYIPQSQRKTILLLSDDLRMSSGIGTVSREIVLNTAHHFNWIQLGAAIQHPDIGKVFDLSPDINGYLGINDSKVILHPNNGYGDSMTIRALMNAYKIDAILHYTDPRFWIWLYHIEHEIRQQIPLLFYHVWDDLPYPLYNAPYYESCDWISCISKQTQNIVKNVWKVNPPEDWQTPYIPHGINEDIFFPIDKNVHKELYLRTLEIKEQLFKPSGIYPEFIVLFNNRNIRRKLVTNVILAFNKFVESLPKDKQDRAFLILHTAPVDENGTDLPTLVNALTPNRNIIFSGNRVDVSDMNCLYNIADVTISLSNAEGFGLSTAESLMAGTPIIATVTGGLQDQMRFENENGEWIDFSTEFGSNHIGKYKKCGEWAIPLFPSAISLTGSPLTPYIAEGYARWEDGADALYTMYQLGQEERNRRGLKGREWMVSEESGMSAYHMAQKFIDGIDTTFKNWTKRKRFSLYNTSTFNHFIRPEHTGFNPIQ